MPAANRPDTGQPTEILPKIVYVQSPPSSICCQRPRRATMAAALGALAGIVLLSAGGCASQSVAETPEAQARVVQNRTASPGVWGAERGLELVSWIVADPAPPRTVTSNSEARQDRRNRDRDSRTNEDESNQEDEKEQERGEEAEEEARPVFTIVDNRKSIKAALAPYADRPVPIPDDVLFRWHAAGFRIVSVPAAELPAIQKSLRLVGPTQRQWLGEVPLWTDLVRGPAFGSSRHVVAGNGEVELEPGRLRLLSRSWIVPDPRPSANGGFPPAALRLELVPQHEPQLSDPHRLLAGASQTGPEAHGRAFPHLALGCYLQRGEALIIVPDSPESDWSRALKRSTQDERGGQKSSASDQEEMHDEEIDRNREDERPTSLGEAMLSTPATTIKPRTRGVIVLIPHVPQRYELR